MPSWDSAEADALWTEYCGKERWLGMTEILGEKIRCAPDDKLWQLRADARKSLVDYVRERLSKQLAASGGASEDFDPEQHIFDANTLTLGFARRFATYKRPNLLLHDPERLLRILTNQEHPVQLIIAGKAHPADQAGQAMIQEWVRFIRRSDARRHVVFLSDYDMLMTERLVQGVDVWINTPRRPWEACGTSGMKVLVNGGLNLSELDGWWAEAYKPDLGWALGDGKEHDNDSTWDAAEAEALYALLEREVIPEFYSRDRSGIPAAWVSRIRESMACLTTHYSSNRAVRQYTEHYYLPAAATYRERADGKGELGEQIVAWQHTLERVWGNLRFGDTTITRDGKQHKFETHVYLNGVEPNAVRVELYADGVRGDNPVRKEMTRGAQLVGAENGYVYGARVPATRPATDYTARVIPYRKGVAVPLEASQILWQR
jgi:starch phosphorylase